MKKIILLSMLFVSKAVFAESGPYVCGCVTTVDDQHSSSYVQLIVTDLSNGQKFYVGLYSGGKDRTDKEKSCNQALSMMAICTQGRAASSQQR